MAHYGHQSFHQPNPNMMDIYRQVMLGNSTLLGTLLHFITFKQKADMENVMSATIILV